MGKVTGVYLLDEASERFFSARMFHLLERRGDVVGRYGRRGILKGSVVNDELRLVWRERDRFGWLTIVFNGVPGGFTGTYGTGPPQSAPVDFCQGRRKVLSGKKRLDS